MSKNEFVKSERVILIIEWVILSLYSNVVWADIIKTMKDITGHFSVTKTLLRDNLTLL